MTLEQRIRQEGRLEGRREGHFEGRQEGRLNAEQDAVVRILELRFGEVPGDLRHRIEEITDGTRIAEWFEKAITSGSLDAFRHAG